MKIVKYTLLALLAVIIIAVVAAWLCFEPLVKSAVHKFGSQVVGTEVNLAGFKLHPFDGTLKIEGLTVANPKGYSAPNLLSLGGIAVKLDTKSLLSDKIIIEDITVSKPEITYEMPDLSTSNVMQIQENVAKNTASDTDAAATEAEVSEETTADSSSSKSVVIKKVLVEGGALSAITPLQKNDTALTLSMPAVEINGIGEGNEKVSLRESITTIFNKILFNATSVVTKALGNASEMAKKATDEAVSTAKEKAAEEAEGLLDKVKFW